MITGTVDTSHLFDNIAGVQSKLVAVAVAKMKEAVTVVSKSAKTSMSPISPPASEPGHAPHHEVRGEHPGALRDAVKTLVYKDEGGGVTGLVWNDSIVAPYGAALELGTTTMAARPWLRPALIRSIPAIQRIFSGTEFTQFSNLDQDR